MASVQLAYFIVLPCEIRYPFRETCVCHSVTGRLRTADRDFQVAKLWLISFLPGDRTADERLYLSPISAAWQGAATLDIFSKHGQNSLRNPVHLVTSNGYIA
jgi:hypothetical protein